MEDQSKLAQRRFSFFQIKRIEPLAEPTVYRSEKFASLIPLALITPEPASSPHVIPRTLPSGRAFPHPTNRSRARTGKSRPRVALGDPVSARVFPQPLVAIRPHAPRTRRLAVGETSRRPQWGGHSPPQSASVPRAPGKRGNLGVDKAPRTPKGHGTRLHLPETGKGRVFGRDSAKLHQRGISGRLPGHQGAAGETALNSRDGIGRRERIGTGVGETLPNSRGGWPEKTCHCSSAKSPAHGGGLGRRLDVAQGLGNAGETQNTGSAAA